MDSGKASLVKGGKLVKYCDNLSDYRFFLSFFFFRIRRVENYTPLVEFRGRKFPLGSQPPRSKFIFIIVLFFTSLKFHSLSSVSSRFNPCWKTSAPRYHASLEKFLATEGKSTARPKLRLVPIFIELGLQRTGNTRAKKWKQDISIRLTWRIIRNDSRLSDRLITSFRFHVIRYRRIFQTKSFPYKIHLDRSLDSKSISIFLILNRARKDNCTWGLKNRGKHPVLRASVSIESRRLRKWRCLSDGKQTSAARKR